jgi:chorismate mutase
MKDIKNIFDWNLGFEPSLRPFLIAGNCAAESEKQVIETAFGVKKAGAQLFRAGIWKPRTRPNSFEGLGQIALPWLQKVQKEANIRICTEIATPQHAEIALNAGVDVLWIGARTSVNPFAVQEIADFLKGKDVPVMVKNPVNPDLELWIGAIERLYNAGLRRIAAIHRGFSVYNKTKYRNEPLWEIAVELRRRMPYLTIINDPSHIAGDSIYLQEIAQTALDMGFDGLMIESHPNPTQAWSDAKQQINPKELETLISQLRNRDTNSENSHFTLNLEQLRAEIDEFDYQILALLSKRMEVARQIGDFKQAHNVAILQMERWNAIYKSRNREADNLKLSNEFISEVWNAIHKESIQQQTAILKSEKVSDDKVKF